MAAVTRGASTATGEDMSGRVGGNGCDAATAARLGPDGWAGYLPGVIVAFLLLAAPVGAALLFWGAWGWVAAAVVVAAVEYAALQRSQKFSARFWRSVGVTRRSRRERGVELAYVLSAAAGVCLLVASLLGVGDHPGR